MFYYYGLFTTYHCYSNQFHPLPINFLLNRLTQDFLDRRRREWKRSIDRNVSTNENGMIIDSIDDVEDNLLVTKQVSKRRMVSKVSENSLGLGVAVIKARTTLSPKEKSTLVDSADLPSLEDDKSPLIVDDGGTKSPLLNDTMSLLKDDVESTQKDIVMSPIKCTTESLLKQGDSTKSPLRGISKSPLKDSVKSPLQDVVKSPAKDAVQSPLRSARIAQSHTVETTSPEASSPSGRPIRKRKSTSDV